MPVPGWIGGSGRRFGRGDGRTLASWRYRWPSAGHENAAARVRAASPSCARASGDSSSHLIPRASAALSPAGKR